MNKNVYSFQKPIKRFTAWLLCAALLFTALPGNIVQAAEAEGAMYTAPTLTLTKAQGKYDLLQDITYNTAIYTLSVADEGGFNIQAVGDYTVSYSLIPIPMPKSEPAAIEPNPNSNSSVTPEPNPDSSVTPEPNPDSSVTLEPTVPEATQMPKTPSVKQVNFTRTVSVVEAAKKNICITFTIDTANFGGKQLTFTDGTQKCVVEIPADSSLAQKDLPILQEVDTGLTVPVSAWQHPISGMSFTEQQLLESVLTKDEAFVASREPEKTCTCGAGDTAENHQSSCALLALPANQEAYTQKASGVPDNKNTRNSHITVPKGMFFLAPDPQQGNAPGSYAWIDTFGAVMNSIDSNAPGNTTDYTIMLCKAEQTLTAADVGKTSLFHKLGGKLDGKGQHVTTDDKAGSLTLSASWSDPDGADTLWDRNPASWGANTRLGLLGAPDDAGVITLPPQVDLGVPTTFRNMQITTATANSKILINAYSNKVTMGEGIENLAGSFLDLFGKTGVPGETTLYDGGTELEIFSGTYHQVCGGYFDAQSQHGGMNEEYLVTGDKHVNLYGGNFYAGGTTSGSPKIFYRNYVVGDSLDDDVQGGTGNVKYSTNGTVSVLVQPMEGLEFVAPPEILLGVYSASLYPGGEDLLTLDTTHYNQPIDMSRTTIAAAPDGSEDGSWPVEGYDGNHTKVRMNINAPQTTLKSLWARGMATDARTDYPAVINLQNIGTVTEYVNGSKRPESRKIGTPDYSTNDNTTLNVNQAVQLNGVRWFSTVNVGENVNLSVNNFEMVFDKAKTEAAAQNELNLAKYTTSGFPMLNLKSGSALSVSKGGANCMLGNVNAAAGTHLSLSCDNYQNNDKSGGMLFGKITAQAAPNQLQIGLSPNSVPLTSGAYGFLYLGNNTTLAPAKIGAIANLQSTDGTIAQKASGAKQFLTLAIANDNPIELSSPTTVKTTYADFSAVKTAMTKAGEVYKIKFLKPYAMTAADYTALAGITTAQCKGLIITGWNEDFGYTLQGDGYQATGETMEDSPEPVGTAGAGKNTPYKNMAPSSANGITLLSKEIQLAVPTTFRNISLRSTVNTPISYRAMSNTQEAGALQIGPGLEQDTTSYMNVYGGRKTVTASDRYDTSVTIYNGKYSTVLSNTDAGAGAQSNSGTSLLNIYGGTFGADDASKIIGTTKGTVQHGGAMDSKSEINIFMSADYVFHLNGTPIMGDSGGTAVNLGSCNINIDNTDGTLFEYFPTVAPLHTNYTGALLHGGSLVKINARNCTFGTVSPSNVNPAGPLLTGGKGTLALDIAAAKSFDRIYGGGIPANPISVTPRTCSITFESGCDTTVKEQLNNWSTLTLMPGTPTATTRVVFGGASGTFFSANGNVLAAVGKLELNENTELQLNNPQNTYGIYEIANTKGTLLLNASESVPGLTVNQQTTTKDAPLTIGLVSGISMGEGTKLLKFTKPDQAVKGNYLKHTSVAASVVKDNTDPIEGNNGHGFVYLSLNASVRVYPAPHNGAPGADPMRYTDYITLYDALVDMEKYPAPKGEKYLVNFISDYTIGYHNDLGALVAASGTGITDDQTKLKEFKGEAAGGTGRLKGISFSSIGQNKPELLTENDMSKLNTVELQSNAAYGKALQLPETNTLALHGADPTKDMGIIFESFQFGNSCGTIAANGSTLTMGATGAANAQPGSVRNVDKTLTIYGGSTLSGVLPESARITINSGEYANVFAGSRNSTEAVTGSSTIDVNGGTAVTMQGIHTTGIATVNFNNTFTVNTVKNFDEVLLRKTVTITEELSYGTESGKTYVGNLTLADSAGLDFQNAQVGARFQAGNFTTGNNSVLFVPKLNTVTVPLQVAGSYTYTGTLTTDVKDSNARVMGDDLIIFATATTPTAEQFFSTSMKIERNTTTPPHTIEYGYPKNPATRLAWVGMGSPETNAPISKTLYFDSMTYDANNLNNDSGTAVDHLFLLNQAQYKAFMSAADKSSGAMTPGKYTKDTTTFTTKPNAAPAESDGIGDGVHTHYYSSLTTVIDPKESYYALTYAGTMWAIALADVYAPDTTVAGRTPKAVRDNGIGDAKKFTLNIPLAELFQGAHTPSGIYRMGWSKTKQFGTGVTAPDRTAIYPANAFNLPPTNGVWNASGMTDVIVNTPVSNTINYSMTVTRPQAKAMTSFYLYVQDVFGSTREIVVTPDWQFVADVTYKPGTANGQVAGADFYDRNIQIGSNTTALSCPSTFVPTGDYAFAGWKVTGGAAGIMNATYYPTNKFPVAQDTVLTAQWLPDGNKDGVPDAWQQKITFQIATANASNASFAGKQQSVTIALPKLNSDGTYSNGYDPAATAKSVTIAAVDVPLPVPNPAYAFTMWTDADTGSTSVTPVGANFSITGTNSEKKYYAHFASNVTGLPLLAHTRVTQGTPSETTASKTLAFDFGLQEATTGSGIGNTQITRAFISQTANWTYGTTEPLDKQEITLGGGAANTIMGTMTGTVSANINEADTWYAYAVTNGNEVKKIVLDTTGATHEKVEVTGGGVIHQKGMDADHKPTNTETISTDISASLTLVDPAKAGVTGYTPSGLYRAGWTTTKLTTEEGTILCGTDGFKALETASRLTLFTDSTSVVTAAEVPSDRLYLYTQDKIGNIRETLVPLVNVYNVSVPTWIGLAAVQNYTDKLITPADGCYIVNNSAQQVDASISNFAVKSGMTNQLTLVTGAPAKNTEMQLNILEKDSNLGFLSTSTAGINPTSPLKLGTIPAVSTTTPQAPHGVGFTFSAKYQKDIPLKLNSWDLFTMSYKFQVTPTTP